MTSFKEKVLEIINKIPRGKVTTYGTIAVLAGLPRGARLVGGILHYGGEELPWQRVVNRHGFISTNCMEHPKQLQKALLEQEGVEVSDDFMIDLKKFGWVPSRHSEPRHGGEESVTNLLKIPPRWSG